VWMTHSDLQAKARAVENGAGSGCHGESMILPNCLALQEDSG
jgi:hypothetical protein